jgi:endonuclease YncB( thermonuclease family)
MRRGEGLGAAIAAGAAIIAGGLSAVAQEQPAAATRCGGEEIARGSVARVVDGRDLVLDDGREVHLAGIEVPVLPVQEESAAPPGGTAAKAALAAFVTGAQIVLRQAGFASDRYGRTVAYVDGVRQGTERLAQAALISAGLARVGDDVGAADCAARLLRDEDAARRAKLGLWASPYYEVLSADKPAEVLARRGRFSLVEGSVVSVRESGPTIYVNFGRRWSEEFTVTIRKRIERKFVAAGLNLKTLAGRRVRVRGWVEKRGGSPGVPWIEAAHPEQIELADAK